MLTIIIFTSKRLEKFIELIGDIKKNNHKLNIPIIIVSYQEERKNLIIIKKLAKLNGYKLYIETKKLSVAEKLKKYTKKVKTKYFWWVSDDDRITNNSVNIINEILKKNNNISGITLANKSILNENIRKKIYFHDRKKKKLENLDIKKKITELGMNSAQITSLKHYTNALKDFSKNEYHNTAYSYLNIIYKIIFKTNNWKYLNNKLVIYRVGNLDNVNAPLALKRLDNEFKGYLIPLKKVYKKEKKNYYAIFREIFFKNIISHILLNFYINGRLKTLRIVLNNLKLIPKKLYIIILIVIFITPNFILKFIKRIKILRSKLNMQ
jgi:hypothetical protein